MSSRVSRDQLYMGIAVMMSERSTCNKAHVGCIITREGRIVSSVYNGAPSGLAHCLDVGCDIDEATGSCVRTSHAEAGAIAFAAREGISVDGATAYCTYSPCISCAKLFINAGIKEIVYIKLYHKDTDRIFRMLQEAGVKVRMYVGE